MTNTTSPDTDLDALRTLGAERTQLTKRLTDVNTAIADHLRRLHDAGVPQHDLVAASGFARESVRLITNRLPWSPSGRVAARRALKERANRGGR